MRSNDPFRVMWRRVAGPPPASRVDLDALADRISLSASRALRARARWTRTAALVGIAAIVIMGLAVSAIPTLPSPTLLGAVSGGQKTARTFEVAVVGPRDGSWLIAAAVGADR